MHSSLVRMRKKILELLYLAKEGHLASSFSVLEIIYSLYASGRVSVNEGEEPGHFILSKGHSALALYVVLNEVGAVSKNDLDSYCKQGSIFAGHPNHKIPGVTFSTGSLGHGINYAVGLCLGFKAQGFNNKVFCLVGDGEMNEGTFWESLLIAQQNNLSNLIIIIDNNRSTDRCLTVFDMSIKLESFGFFVKICDGNNLQNLFDIYNELSDKKMYAIVANTIKGYGLKKIENSFEWHHKSPSDLEYKEFVNELDFKQI
jgi:transketolase